MPIERITAVPPLPARPEDGNKGTFGRVLIVGGSEEMIGAPVFAGTAALRVGSGLVQLAMPAGVLAAALSTAPELIGLALSDDDLSRKKLLDAAGKADVVVLGPGLGQSTEAGKRVDLLIGLENKCTVIDADGLNYLASLGRWPSAAFKAHAVLTPHPGEMKRLGKLIGREEMPKDDDGRIDLAVAASNAFGQAIVLKGHRTVVTDGARVYLNDTGDSSLAKAGTGDILSGVLGSLLGQGMGRFEAACLAVHLHGRAGEIAGKKLGRRCVLGRDVIDAISDAVRESDVSRA